MMNWIAAALLIAGCFFYIAGTVGLLRLPDGFSRLHALTKADNLGLGFLVLGLILLAPDWLYALKLVLIWLLVVISGASGAHLIAKRALQDQREEI
ncbi:monovalent cation/H(+) antiporter subunit G [Thioalkalicoccus limnaeus]|uniref:Monovalent cation/H(+) antiporter subunit G n=1 Tax=Thioalkalicoccus limnaeus TaxID=120681 RepID=A0ABV4BHJ8_9GAMM